MTLRTTLIIPFLSMFFLASNGYGQTINPGITARVDTSNVAVKSVYHLYKNYLNSRPDSIYKNPNWNSTDADYYLKAKGLRIDRGAEQMFVYHNSEQYFKVYIPKILQIDSIAKGRYQVKTLFTSNNTAKEYEKHTTFGITKLYAVRNQNNEFKLENCIDYDTRNWKTYKYKFITYIVHPSLNFNKKEAQKAAVFCKMFCEKMGVSVKPFKYYMLPNVDELGKLYNYDYWTYYIGGQTITPLNEIFTTYGNEYFPHEFVHLLLPVKEEEKLYAPMIVTEGIATWFAGAGQNENFEQGLLRVSDFLKDKPDVTIDDIIKFNVRFEFDNSILYVTGGTLFKMVHDKHGIDGVWKLYNSNEENFKSVLEELYGLPYSEINKTVMDYLRNYRLNFKS